MSEKVGINKAVDMLKSLFQELDVKFEYDIQRINEQYKRADIYGWIKYGRKRNPLFIEIKSSGEPRMIEQFIGYYRNNQTDEYPIIIAPYIGTLGRNICIEQGIGFLDLSGNAYIKLNWLLIDRWGRENKFKHKRSLKSVFSTKATWVIRKFLAEPKKSWKLEELANESGVSIGHVSKVVDKLDRQGFLKRKWGSITLKKPGELLDLWRSIYSLDDLVMRGFYCPFEDRNELFNELRNINVDWYALTMGVGATVIAPFVRSTDTHMYIKDQEIMISILKLTPVEFGGNMYLIEPPDRGYMMNIQKKEGLKVVSNIQLYLDLYFYPKRGREQADYLRENVLRI